MRNDSLAPKGRQGHRLSGDDIEYLRKNTRYDEKEIKEWYKGFKVREGPTPTPPFVICCALSCLKSRLTAP